MDVNASNYKDGPRNTAKNVRCVTRTAVDETVEHLVLECARYERDKMMTCIILTEQGGETNEIAERMGRVLLLGLCEDREKCTDDGNSERVFGRMWCTRHS